MKTSGSLRYIRNDELTNALQQYYDVFLARAIRGSEMGTVYYTNTINPFVLKHFRVQDFDFIGDSVRTTNPVILDRTNQTDQELLNIIEGYAGLHKVTLERLVLPLVKKLDELIGLLKKEYHLQ